MQLSNHVCSEYFYSVDLLAALAGGFTHLESRCWNLFMLLPGISIVLSRFKPAASHMFINVHCILVKHLTIVNYLILREHSQNK